MFRAYHTVTGLEILADSMTDLDSKYDLGQSDELKQLKVLILDVSRDLEHAVSPAGLANGRPPAPQLEKFSADQADKTELVLAALAERAFKIGGVLLDQIESRRT